MKKTLIFIVYALSCVLVAGCSQNNAASGIKPSSTEKSSLESKKATSEPVKIGVLFSQTGGVAAFGKPYHDGAMLAIEEINKNGGINGRQIEAVVADTESNVDVTIASAKSLKEKGVVGIVGPDTSGLHNPLIPTIEKLQIPNIPSSGGMNMYTPIPKYSFSIQYGGKYLLSSQALYWKKQGVKNIVLLTTADSTGSGAIKEAEYIEKTYGLKVLGTEQRPGTDTDLTASISKLMALKPDAMLLYASPPAFVKTALKNMGELGWDRPIGYAGASRLVSVLSDVPDSIASKITAPGPKVLVYNQLKKEDKAAEGVNAYVTKFKAKYTGANEDQVVLGAQGYDAAMQLADAIKNAGTEQEKIRDWLEGVKGWVGGNGYSFTRAPDNHEGVIVEDSIIAGVKKGNPNFVLLNYTSDLMK